jgi:hypothetical protein
MNDLVGEAALIPLFDQAEAVRWRMSDIPWSKVDAAAAPDELRALIREVAFSELTTYTATRRFMADCADDVDLTQWIAVWFYEESKHAQVLLRWLHVLGIGVDDAFMTKGRATAPFMRSRMGTLVTNVISELVASASYRRLWERSPEPVLAQIGRRLCADEARHAASFFVYAQRHLARAADRDAERRDALKVLYLWFSGNELVSHPVNEFFARIDVGFDLAALRDRITRSIGALVELPIDGGSDLLAHIRALGGDR